jgi:hypothetical protein
LAYAVAGAANHHIYRPTVRAVERVDVSDVDAAYLMAVVVLKREQGVHRDEEVPIHHH